jgi:hypothetical protein
MRDLTVTMDFLHIAAFDAALRAALPGKIVGVSAPVAANGHVLSRANAGQSGNRTLLVGQVRVHLDDTATPADEALVNGLALAHDPVFLSVDKTTILAAHAPTDAVTVSVWSPKMGAAPVTLIIARTAVPVTLTEGIGTVVINSADPASVGVSLQNPANRSTDQLVIEAR